VNLEPDSTPSRDPNDRDELELDALLARAQWPQLPPGAHERLRGTWRASFGRARSLRPWLTGIAATLAVAAGTLVLLRHNPLRQQSEPQVQSNAMRPQAQVRPIAVTTIVVKERSREPNPYERFLAGPVLRTPARQATTAPATQRLDRSRVPVAPGAPPPGAPAMSAAELERRRVQGLVMSSNRGDVREFLQLVLDVRTRESALDALAELHDRAPLDLLARELNNGRVEHRYAAAIALGSACDAQVVGRLCAMVKRNLHRREALAALLQCHDPAAARYLDAARGDPVIDAEVRSVQAQLKRIL
jgi:hypothetical protein